MEHWGTWIKPKEPRPIGKKRTDVESIGEREVEMNFDEKGAGRWEQVSSKEEPCRLSFWLAVYCTFPRARRHTGPSLPPHH